MLAAEIQNPLAKWGYLVYLAQDFDRSLDEFNAIGPELVLFVNNATRQRGLVCHYDVVCFEEVSGISFDQKDGVKGLQPHN